jgi:hypothetical protein
MISGYFINKQSDCDLFEHSFFGVLANKAKGFLRFIKIKTGV